VHVIEMTCGAVVAAVIGVLLLLWLFRGTVAKKRPKLTDEQRRAAHIEAVRRKVDARPRHGTRHVALDADSLNALAPGTHPFSCIIHSACRHHRYGIELIVESDRSAHIRCIHCEREEIPYSSAAEAMVLKNYEGLP